MADNEKASHEETEPSAAELSPAEGHEIPEAEIVEEKAENAEEKDAAMVQDAPKPAVPSVDPDPEPGSSGFWSGLVGGVAASAIAFGAYWTVDRSDAPDLTPLTTELEDQTAKTDALVTEIESLKAELTALQSAPRAGEGIEARFGTLEAEITESFNEIATQQDRLTSTLSVLEGRIAQVEARPPVFEGDASEATGEVIAQMRATLEAQKAEVETLADEARAQLEAVQSEAAAMQADAAAATKAAATQAALSQLMAALDAGGPFSGPLSDFTDASGIEAPDILIEHAETGISTLADLQASFPDAARAALSASSKNALSEDADTFDRIGAFLMSQTGARSLEPREGDSPNAVLSRAEAALAQGQLSEALDLIAQLPEDGQAEMANWSAMASARHAALTAASSLAAK